MRVCSLSADPRERTHCGDAVKCLCHPTRGMFADSGTDMDRMNCKGAGASVGAVQRQRLPVQPCAGQVAPCDFRAAARDATGSLTLGYFPSSDLILGRIAQILEYGHINHVDVEMQWNIRTFEEKLSKEPGENSKNAHLHFCETRLRRGICLILFR
ncbi:unnamed protein product [Ectocarpus sp. 12 AP-2014]